LELPFLRCYRHRATGLPLALVRGCAPDGKLFGGIVHFRTLDDSGNIVMEALLHQLRDTLGFAETMMAQIEVEDGNVAALWERFLDTLSKELAQKTGRNQDGERIPLIPIELQASQEVQAQVQECMICLDKPADTTVVPCLHTVVCADCSPKLQATADAKICCQCRLPIEGIYYPDNSVTKV
jgi:hypothetical protein